MRRSALLFDAGNQPTPQFTDFLRDVGVPGANLVEIDSALQARFFQKNPDGSPKERWELKEVAVNCPADRIKQHLAACGFLNETRPSSKSYTYAAWPGALVNRAAIRFSDLMNAWKGDGSYDGGIRWKELIVFGGKRPLQPDKENYEQCCRAIGLTGLVSWEPESYKECDSWEYIRPETELDMMRWIRHNHPEVPRDIDDKITIPTTFVDAPMKPPTKEGGQPVRPNTEDTIVEWLKSNPKPGSVLLSCGAPYGMAIDEAFWMFLEPHDFTVETFGRAAPDLPIENFMREVAGAVNRIRRARKV